MSSLNEEMRIILMSDANLTEKDVGTKKIKPYSLISKINKAVRGAIEDLRTDLVNKEKDQNYIRNSFLHQDYIDVVIDNKIDIKDFKGVNLDTTITKLLEQTWDAREFNEKQLDAFALYLTGEGAREFYKESRYNKKEKNKVILNNYYENIEQGTTEPSEKHPKDYFTQKTIEKSTKDFVGRGWVFEQVDAFISKNSSGYFLIEGDPGIGKTALLSTITQRQNCFYHFNISTIGKNTSKGFHENICRQIIDSHDFKDIRTTQSSFENGDLFCKLLDRLSQSNQKNLFVIDALDEVDIGERSESLKNILFLPNEYDLPPNNYFVLSSRPDSLIRLPKKNKEADIILNQDSRLHREDIETYIKIQSEKPFMKNLLNISKVKLGKFREELINKSQWNFIYLAYQFDSFLEQSKKNKKIAFENIPAGLPQYYQSNFNRLKRHNHNQQIILFKVLASFCMNYKPISAEHISKTSKTDIFLVKAILRQISQFLHPIKDDQIRYRIYHYSFFEFLKEQPEIVDLIQILKSERIDYFNDHFKK